MACWWLFTISFPLCCYSVNALQEEIDLHKYLRLAIVDKKGILNQNLHTSVEPAFIVLGITPSCTTYFGWLHRINLYSGTLMVEVSERICHDYLPFIIRTANTNDMLLIAVKRIGRRIMVQSIASMKKLNMHLAQSGAVIMPFNGNVRHRQFFTQEFPDGFHYRGAFSMKNRVIIYGYDYSEVMLIELTVMQSEEQIRNSQEDRILVPFLKKPITINPILAVPSDIFIQETFTESDRPSILIGSHHFTFANKPMDVIRIPLSSVIQQRFYGAQIEEYDGYQFRTLGGNFSMYSNRKVREHLGAFRIITHLIDLPLWDTTQLPPVEKVLKGFTIRTWMNPYRTHRRMAYPHTVHRALRYHIFDGWKKFMPALLANLFIFLILLQVAYQVIQVQEKLKVSLGILSSSQSAHSF